MNGFEPERPDEPAHRRRPAPTTRLTGRDRGPGMLVTGIVIFLAIAWIKPWPPPPPPPEQVAAPPTAAPPTPTADPLSNLKYHCQEPSGWRVYAREEWGGRALRSWRTLDPVLTASGPLDTGIPIVPLGALITNLGYCSPWNTAERPPADAAVTVWRLEAAAGAAPARTATAVAVHALGPDPATVVAALYAAPSLPDGSVSPRRSAVPADHWEAGGWVFAVRGTDYERWWAVRIENPPPENDSPAPSGADAGAGSEKAGVTASP